jgi:hypothetical protein
VTVRAACRVEADARENNLIRTVNGARCRRQNVPDHVGTWFNIVWTGNHSNSAVFDERGNTEVQINCSTSDEMMDVKRELNDNGSARVDSDTFSRRIR